MEALEQAFSMELTAGLVDSVSPEGLGRVGEHIARRGASVVEAGLERLLGGPADSDRDDDR